MLKLFKTSPHEVRLTLCRPAPGTHTYTNIQMYTFAPIKPNVLTCLSVFCRDPSFHWSVYWDMSDVAVLHSNTVLSDQSGSGDGDWGQNEHYGCSDQCIKLILSMTYKAAERSVIFQSMTGWSDTSWPSSLLLLLLLTVLKLLLNQIFLCAIKSEDSPGVLHKQKSCWFYWVFDKFFEEMCNMIIYQ